MRKIAMLAMQYERTIADMAQQQTVSMEGGGEGHGRGGEGHGRGRRGAWEGEEGASQRVLKEGKLAFIGR